MGLDEQLRQLADQVPTPPSGDPSAVFRRGLRRRRWWKAGRTVAAVVILGVIGVGTAALIDRPAQIGIANQPPAAEKDAHQTDVTTDGPVITGRPAAINSSIEPFRWAVAVSPGEGGRWCLTVIRGGTGIPVEREGQPCDQPVDPGQIAGWDESAPDASGQRLAWGFVPPHTDAVAVEFTDDVRRSAELSLGDVGGARFWAIGYESGTVEAIEAIHGGQVIAGGTVLDGFDVGDIILLLGCAAGIALFVAIAWRLVRRRRS